VFGIANGINLGILPSYIQEILPETLISGFSLMIEFMLSLGLVSG
jgi:hypothetical protein